MHPGAGFAGVPHAASGPPVTKVVEVRSLSRRKLKRNGDCLPRGIGVKEGGVDAMVSGIALAGFLDTKSGFRRRFPGWCNCCAWK